jgi:hypothetical protein
VPPRWSVPFAKPEIECSRLTGEMLLWFYASPSWALLPGLTKAQAGGSTVTRSKIIVGTGGDFITDCSICGTLSGR